MKKGRIVGIDYLKSSSPRGGVSIVMLHGFGASMDDLASLRDYLDPDEQHQWIFPNGIKEVPIGPHMTGRAWFPIRMKEIELAAMRGGHVDFSNEVPDGLQEAQDRLLKFISELDLKSENIVLGGFSQGAMMSCQLALAAGLRCKGLLLFSGNPINLSNWLVGAKRCEGLKFFQSHGTLDPILSHQQAKKLFDSLVSAGLSGVFKTFEGHHEIPLSVLREAQSFLARSVDKTSLEN